MRKQKVVRIRVEDSIHMTAREVYGAVAKGIFEPISMKGTFKKKGRKK